MKKQTKTLTLKPHDSFVNIDVKNAVDDEAALPVVREIIPVLNADHSESWH